MLKYIPNILTILRLAAIVPFLLLLYHMRYDSACILFLAAGLTDGLDGWLARRFSWQSNLGSFLDPLADKLLVFSSFVALGLIGSLPWWLVILVFARDFTISLGVVAWYFLIQKKLDFEPSTVSKINTCMQISLVTLCLVELAFFALPQGVITAWVFLTACTTVISYIDYVWTWGLKAYVAIQQQKHHE
jgi:cardiolipin synthase (CMP-forming)